MIDLALGTVWSLSGNWTAPGLSAAAAVRPVPVVELQVAAAGFALDRGRTTDEFRQTGVFGSLSFTQVRGFGEVTVGVFPLAVEHDGWHTSAGLRVGGALVAREVGIQDLDDWVSAEDPATRPGWVVSGVGEIGRGHVGGRLVLEHLKWVEPEGYRPSVLCPSVAVFARW